MGELGPGDRVTPDVKLVRALRQGGMGSVWLAHHEGFDTEVVVKLLVDGPQGDEESRERFLREAAAAAKVNSPHVVKIFDYGVADAGEPFIVMEYLEGDDLGQVIQARGSLGLEEVAHVVEQTGRALDAAHRRGIIHRDVKPANIFLIDVGARLPHVKLVDFGVAKATSAMTLTSTGQLVGTPVYMSPEQIGGEEVDHRADLWSLGVVAFRALTGKRPFYGEAMATVAYKVIHADLPLPTDVDPRLPTTIDGWFKRACARDRTQRFSNARNMADALWQAVGMPQAASWSGETQRDSRPALAVGSNPSGVTVVDGSGRHLPEEHTAGSLKVSVATVPPPRPSRWRTVAVALAVPLALGAGYALASLRAPAEAPPAEVDPAGRPADDEAPSPEEREPAQAPFDAAADDGPEPEEETTPPPEATASATSSAVAKPPQKRLPRGPRPVPQPDDGDLDLGF